MLGGFEVSIDTEAIHEGEDWRARLGNLIAGADTVVFILSSRSAESPVCRWEVEEAERLSKRILPVQAAPLDGTRPPKQLSALNYVRFDPHEDGRPRSFIQGMVGLRRALTTDVGWLREHTRLLVRAREWEATGRAGNRLLSGSDIALAKAWLAGRPQGAPAPTEVHHDFISASEKAEEARVLAERERVNRLQSALDTAEAARQTAEESRQAAEEARVAQAAASRRVVQSIAFGLAAALVLAGVAGWFGWQSRLAERRAEQQASRAENASERFRQIIERIAIEQTSKHADRIAAVDARISKAVFDAMVSFEVVSDSEYRNKYEHPIVPGGASGVTIGIGYDVGWSTIQAVTDDWEPYVTKTDLERLKQVVGLRGDAAKKSLGNVQDIFIPYVAATTVFKLTTLPRFIKNLDRAMPGAEKLPPDCSGVLVSLVYNRGTGLGGDRRNACYQGSYRVWEFRENSG
jgi:hypothetical protein